MRLALIVLVPTLTLALATLLAHADEPDSEMIQTTIRASLANLRTVVAALDSFHATYAMYPQRLLELVPNFIVALPEDPCTRKAFGTAQGYAYMVVGNPATDFLLRTNWSGSAGALCWSATKTNYQYTPHGGLVQNP